MNRVLSRAKREPDPETEIVSIHGLGQIGLPTAALFANCGYTVIGHDVDERTLTRLRTGEYRSTEPELEAYVERALEGSMYLSDGVEPADYHLVCVPTPYDESADHPDTTYVEAATDAVSSVLRPGDAVVVESTVPPGTTAELVGPILESDDIAVGDEVDLAYAPETILPGNLLEELITNDRIVGGISRRSTDRVAKLFRSVVDGSVARAPDPTTAEFAKLIQNAHRDVNVAFANELARLADDHGVETRKAIRLANRHPRVDILSPGLGVGGECLPVDPLFLGQRSDDDRLVRCARRVNDSMPRYVADRLARALGDLDARIVAILGVAYKANVADARNSPGLQFARELQRGADGAAPDVSVKLTDPHVEDDTLALHSLTDALRGADALVLATAHDEYADLTPSTVASLMGGDVVVDTRGCLEESVWRGAGFTLETL